MAALNILTLVSVVTVGLAASMLQPDCLCTKEFNPVCGSDGMTYSNPCTLRCTQQTSQPDLTAACPGRCPCRASDELEQFDDPGAPQTNDLCICPLNFDPVCASNGVTYSNECFLSCAQAKDPSIQFVRPGEC